MAASKQFLTLAEDLTCSICLSLFVEPVRLKCDHNFCESCIRKCWENQRGDVSCPECRAVFSRKWYESNRVLKNLSEKAWQLELNPEPQDRSHCEEHDEKLKLFCLEDQTLICVICRDSPAHSAHSFLPLPDAVRKYKDQLKSSLDSMEDRKKSKSELKRQQEEKISELDELTGSLERHIAEQFDQIHQYLEDKKKNLIEELRKQREEDFQSMEMNLATVDEELSSLEEDISNLQAVIDQKDNITFLKEMKGLPERCLGNDENGSEGEEGSDDEDDDENEREGSDDEDDDDEDYDDENKREGSDEESGSGSEEHDEDTVGISDLTLGIFRGPLLYAVWKEMKEIISPVPEPLFFDPNTAHPQLILSEDQTSVKVSDREVSFCNNPERFDTSLSVLGSEGFTSGKHYWEVEVGDESEWIVGVATESANRKGVISLHPEDGYWVLSLTNGDVNEADEIFELNVKPRMVGVYLDYEGGQLSFYDADDMSHLSTYTNTFTEKLFPYFSLNVNDSGEHAEPLKLHHLAM
ncbi:zinc-binding protein A33-like [Heterodontus francisci]|uniref:zinc-binding protein A33-like n=1 Tax=Heterodontus francisci TaxID=7792 RepID=UPI00355C80AD